MSRPLFEITADIAALLDSVEEEIQPDLEPLFASLESEEGVKLDGYLNAIKQLEMEAKAADDEADLYAKRAKVRKNRVTHMKDRLKIHLQMTGRDKVVTKSGRPIALRANGGILPLHIDGVSPTEFPPELTKTIVEVDKAKVREALERGETLQWARLGERGVSLRIG